MNVDDVKYIKTHFRRLICTECGGDTMDDVLRRVKACSSMEDTGRMFQRCCTNARGGERLGNGSTIPTVNRRAVTALIQACLQHGVGLLTDKEMDRLQRMFHKSREGGGPPPPS
jgi:hypothetical protein